MCVFYLSVNTNEYEKQNMDIYYGCLLGIQLIFDAKTGRSCRPYFLFIKMKDAKMVKEQWIGMKKKDAFPIQVDFAIMLFPYTATS